MKPAQKPAQKPASKPARKAAAPARTTLDPAEQARFAALSHDWWREGGSFSALQAYNPLRISFIREAVASIQGRELQGKTPFEGLQILDIGCGGGLLAEPLARLGGSVTGIDATPAAIAAAKAHAKESGLSVDYRVSTIERFKPGRKFDVVIASEVLEHVTDVEGFLTHAAALVRPGGALVVTTVNRTLRALAFGIIAAEHVLRLVPIGTHSWKKFVKPSEIAAVLHQNGFTVEDIRGALFNPLTGQMRPSHTDLAVNYMLWARKAK